MTDKVKLCVIGCGAFAGFYSSILKRFRNVELYFCSRSMGKARDFCERFNGKGVFCGIKEAAESQVHAFLVFTPHHVHLENVELLSKTGRYILLQKPIAGSLEHAEQIVKICEREKAKVMMAENYWFNPGIRRAKALLDAGTIRKPIFLYAQSISSLIPTGWRTKKAEMGGGILVDLGIHFLSAFQYLFGPPDKVQADLPEFKIPGLEGESAISVYAKMTGGMNCCLNLSWGIKGGARRKVFINLTGDNGEIIINFGSRFLILNQNHKKKRCFLGFRDLFGHRALLEDFIKSVQNNSEIELNHKVGLDDLSFVYKAYQSLDLA
ncbi:MAG: Gfo/Idh/MocA family oxidoreductase [bacterium]